MEMISTLKTLKALLNMVLPSLIFYVIYRSWSIMPAAITALIFSGVNIFFSAHHGKVKNTQILGILGLVGSIAAIHFTGEEKFYYVPSLIENIIFLGFMIFLCIRRKSILHFIAKDFDVAYLKQIPEDRLMNVNIVWLIFFSLKIAAKIIGLLYMNFKTLYWLVFLLGDPMTIVTIAISVILIRRTVLSEQNPMTESNK